MQDYLTEIEIEKVEKMCEDTVLVDAIEKVMCQGIFTHGVVQKGFPFNPLKNAALNLAAISTENPITNEIMGEHIRGVWAGLNALHNAMKDLKSIKTKKVEAIETPYNEAV